MYILLLISILRPTLLGGHTPWGTKIKPAHKKIFDDVG
jgi:hypothetical protein